MGQTLYEKVFDAHAVRRLPSGQYQLLMGLHLIHEVTSPQAFAMLRERGLARAASRAHVRDRRPHHPDPQRRRARSPTRWPRRCCSTRAQLRASTASASSTPAGGEQGIVHVIGPEQGLTQPGMTICCGDSPHLDARRVRRDRVRHRHVAGARRARARSASRMDKLEGAPHRGERHGSPPGVYAKDVILYDHQPPRRATAASATRTSTRAT